MSTVPPIIQREINRIERLPSVKYVDAIRNIKTYYNKIGEGNFATVHTNRNKEFVIRIERTETNEVYNTYKKFLKHKLNNIVQIYYVKQLGDYLLTIQEYLQPLESKTYTFLDNLMKFIDHSATYSSDMSIKSNVLLYGEINDMIEINNGKIEFNSIALRIQNTIRNAFVMPEDTKESLDYARKLVDKLQENKPHIEQLSNMSEQYFSILNHAHYDLYPRNIMQDVTGNLKLIDLYI